MTAEPQLQLFPAAMAAQFENFHADNPDNYYQVARIDGRFGLQLAVKLVGFALALSTPGGITIAGLFALGFLDRTTAIAAATAMLALAALMAFASALSLAGTRAAIDRLGPNAARDAPAAPGPRLSLAARAIWPAVLRLRRAWREHAAHAEAQLANARLDSARFNRLSTTNAISTPAIARNVRP